MKLRQHFVTQNLVRKGIMMEVKKKGFCINKSSVRHPKK